MPYITDPLQNKIAQFFESDGVSFSYSPPRSGISVPITEDEYFDAQARIERYASIAKVGMLVIGGGAIAWAYWQTFHGAAIGPSALIAFLAFFIPGIFLNILAMRFATHQCDIRLRQYTRDKLGWRRKGLKRGLRDLGVSPWSVAVAAAIILAVVPFGLRDFIRRLAVFNHGTTIAAIVTRSDTNNSKGICRLDYSYSFLGTIYVGKTIGCEVMRDHPVGSRIIIRMASNSPNYSVPQNEGLWTIDAVGPFIGIGAGLLMALSAFSAARSYGPPSPRET